MAQGVPAFDACVAESPAGGQAAARQAAKERLMLKRAGLKRPEPEKPLDEDEEGSDEGEEEQEEEERAGGAGQVRSLGVVWCNVEDHASHPSASSLARLSCSPLLPMLTLLSFQCVLSKEEERERKRLRRLLRNRVSAQLARERKKKLAEATESRAEELEGHTLALAQRLERLERENAALRQVCVVDTFWYPRA